VGNYIKRRVLVIHIVLKTYTHPKYTEVKVILEQTIKALRGKRVVAILFL